MKNIVLLLPLLVLVSCSGGRNSTGYSIINDMMYSETAEPFFESTVFANGQTMQLAPKGTIARGFMPHPKTDDMSAGYGQSPDGKSWKVLENPYEMTEYAWERGEHLYKVNCAICHGVKGKKYGEAVKRGYPKPPKFSARRFKYSKKDKYPAGNIYNVITFGWGNMPSYSQQLYEQDRWYVAEYVRERLMVKGKKK